ncbi:tyrosine-type recombinase/integrase [Synechocystis sp. PCC 7509]|uniref:tyrosine-type recombinase/integrase n=1 Tax=Synechocystis sp. PCC 7509 TaxID=927677 RepID=UPI0006841E8A|nr:tyrosine-type recombinase/integrase [Synechocystis sp. PCC 7509]
MSNLFNLNLEEDDWLTAQNIETKQLLKNPLLQKDIWRTIEDLKLKVNEHDKVLIIRFESIEQDWLKLLAKLYILIRSQRNLVADYLYSEVRYLKRFSQLIKNKSISSAEQINNHLFEEFGYYLRSLKLSQTSISLHYMTLINFFNICRQEGWLEVNTYWFKGKCKRASPKNDEIEYIPEEVWQQLDTHLHHLPEPIQRMVLVIRGTGLRIGELLNLPLDCLRQRGKQWRLRLLTQKYQTEDELPICPELVALIQEQQDYIRHHFGDTYDKLFGSNRGGNYYQPVPRVTHASTFNAWLNRLGKKYNICTRDSQLWHFKSHQFRKTLATVMTNAGVRDLIIQKYLRHRSPDMQNYYKHLLKQVLGDEYRELMKEIKYVDSTGKLVSSHTPKNPITELLRRKMYQITTQYGECHRPVLKSLCQTVNACWRCEHWQTSTDDLNALTDDLQRIEAELEIITKLEMLRQQQGLTSDQQSLAIRIQGLEKINDRS